MNHIKRLQIEAAAKDARILALEEGIARMVQYVSSEKYWQDPYVSTTDIILRCRETVSNALDVENIAYSDAKLALTNE